MMLFETMMQRPQWEIRPLEYRAEIDTLAREYAQDAGNNKAQTKSDLERLLQESETHLKDAPAMDGQTGETGLNAALQNGIARNKALLRIMLFKAICYHLNARGVKVFTPQQAAAIKRKYCIDVTQLKAGHVATIPAPERLTAEDATALFAGLTENGLISGPPAAFSYHFGPIPAQGTKPPENGLSWNGSAAQLAYFIKALAVHVAGAYGAANRTRAVCLALGFNDRQRINTINPYINGKDQRTEGRETIDKIFNELPRRKEAQQ